MTPITYIQGDATDPQAAGQKIIAHCCNDAGQWGAGFSGALSRRCPEAELLYRQWSRRDLSKPFRLGEVQFVKCLRPGAAGGGGAGVGGGDLWAANIIGQVGVRSSTNPRPVRYDALRRGLRDVFLEASVLNASVHMPRIGCGLAGGDWREVELIVNHELAANDIPVMDRSGRVILYPRSRAWAFEMRPRRAHNRSLSVRQVAELGEGSDFHGSFWRFGVSVRIRFRTTLNPIP